MSILETDGESRVFDTSTFLAALDKGGRFQAAPKNLVTTGQSSKQAMGDSLCPAGELIAYPATFGFRGGDGLSGRLVALMQNSRGGS